MTLLGAILKRVQSTESISRKYPSPPPMVDEIVAPKKKKPIYKYTHVRAKVDTSAPRYTPSALRSLLASQKTFTDLVADNLRLVIALKKARCLGGVDSRWDTLPPGTREYYERRQTFLKQIQAANKMIYKRIANTGPRVQSTAGLEREWCAVRDEMVRRARAPFVLFPPLPTELVEDAAFLPPAGVTRPRVRVSLRVAGGARLGALRLELFAEVCPRTCALFLELLLGDGLGHGYVGTRFFRKVPGVFWSGGDVVHDSGCGCYAQRGRRAPVGAENLHFSHSMPGLLSMRVTKDDEMCGIFNITFKPLPQFDLRNEVFGRVIRPCATYDAITCLGAPLSPQPVVVVEGARWRGRGGAPNTRLARPALAETITRKSKLPVCSNL